MTLPANLPAYYITVSEINVELGRAAATSTDLAFLNGLIIPSQRPGSPDMGAFLGKTYINNQAHGNCDGTYIPNCNCNTGPTQCAWPGHDDNCATGNCPVVAPSNCNCNNGDNSKNCHVCKNCQVINCANCDTQKWLQNESNCAAPTYNCTAFECFSQACNCSKIICTKLHELGLMSQNIFDADQQFGEYLRKNEPRIYEGYIRWAKIIVDGMSGTGPDFMFWLNKDIRKQRESEIVIKWAHKVATPWSEHMAYLMQARDRDNDIGRNLMKVGRFISKMVSFLPKSNKPASLTTIALTWLVFTSTYYISVFYTNIVNLFKNRRILNV
jgi:hypothetical protein